MPNVRQDGDLAFGQLIRTWRTARRLSQLELAGDADVSSRHLSFLETGRARPSREMVSRLAAALDVPAREQNILFHSAGFAPLHVERELDDDALEPALRGIEFLLDSHEPFPAFVLDRAWNIVRANESHDILLHWLLPALEPRCPVNILRLLADPAGMRPLIANWRVVMATLLRRLERQLELPQADEVLARLERELLTYPGLRELISAPPEIDPSSILVPVEIDAHGERLSWFSTLARFGSAIDLTLQEVTIESLHPADRRTAERVPQLRRELGTESPGESRGPRG